VRHGTCANKVKIFNKRKTNPPLGKYRHKVAPNASSLRTFPTAVKVLALPTVIFIFVTVRSMMRNGLTNKEVI